MDFSSALRQLKAGNHVARENWNGKGQYLTVVRAEGDLNYTVDVIAIVPVGGGLVPWVASQTDLMANDWVMVGQVANGV